ncbi:Low-density receptor-like protein [Quillaja saponaria]|uniref:Low-density receptor-like protein n=1 Tax=Quillaja saponaria TaxID=32244 RepID=A0AAD7PGR5_QUISA|nr:Low-density receptor-like protein [Quillaja saponaria]
MASSTAKVTFRIAMVSLILLLLFYVGRPLYWKISATIHEIQRKQTKCQRRYFPDRYGSSEISWLVPWRVRLGGPCHK